MSDWFKKSNCNKAMCKTCIFRTDGNQLELSPERRNEIETYLRTFKSSHLCHTTNKTCFGGLKVQAEMMYRMGMIKEENVEIMLTEAEKYLKFN